MRRQRDEAAPVAPPPGSIVSPLVLLVTVVSDVGGEVVAIAAILGNVEVVPSETGQILSWVSRGSSGRRIELLRGEISVGLEHPVDRVQQFPHHRDIGLQRLLSPRNELIEEHPHLALMPDDDQGRHEEDPPDVRVAHLGDMHGLVDRTPGLPGPRIEARMRDLFAVRALWTT